MGRKRIDFWVDKEKPDDKRVLKTVEALRKKRDFAQTVKDGIMVMSQLAKGKTDLLFKLHPWIVDKILASAPKTDTTDLEKQIAELKRIVLERGGESIPPPPPNYPQMKPSGLTAGQGSTIGKGVVMSLPNFDDDDDDLDIPVPIKKSTGSSTGANFLSDYFGSMDH